MSITPLTHDKGNDTMSFAKTTTKTCVTHASHQPNFNRLFSILNMKRPGGTEATVAARWLSPYDPVRYYAPIQPGAVTNDPMAYSITVGDKANPSRTLFSAHLDTVHVTGGERKVKYDPKTGIITSPDGTPLGADDGAGIWLLLELIDAGVPGTYLFTTGEERGGIGAKYMALNHDDLLEKHDRAIAFDRKATHSVISHQGWGRCCSDDFANALADELNRWLPDDHAFMAPDDTGIYTDTAEYTDAIPECTNVSVGYNNEHTQNESLNLPFLISLRDAAINANWDALPTKRKAGEQDVVDYGRWGANDYGTSYFKPTVVHDDKPQWLEAHDFCNMRFSEIIKYVKDTPIEQIAETIDMLAMQVCELQQTIEMHEAIPDEPDDALDYPLNRFI